MHRGEAEAIILALELSRESNYLIIDDMKARNYAEAKGINTIGAIGVIAQAFRENIIEPEEVETCINIMKKSNRFYNEALYNILRIAASEVVTTKAISADINDNLNEKVLTKSFISSKKQKNFDEPR